MIRRAMMIAVLPVAVAVAATACAGRSTARGTPHERPARIVLAANQGRPFATLLSAGSHQAGVPGSYCWQSDGVSRCVDAAPSVLEPRSYLQLRRGEMLGIGGDSRGSTAALWSITPGQIGSSPGAVRPVLGVESSGNGISVTAEPGRYTLEVDGVWPEGRVPFFFGIQVA